MKKIAKILKFLCVLVIAHSFTVHVEAQKVLLHEGFEQDSNGWKVVNNTTNKWQVLSGGFNTYEGDRCMYVTTGGDGSSTDCWLISTPLQLVAGKKYSISFHYKCQTLMSNRLEVSLGPNVTTSKGTVVWKNTFNNDVYTKGQVNYTATTTANTYLRFHCTTPKMYTYLYFDSVTVEEVNCFEPLNIQFSNVQSTSITASWNKVDGASSYEYSIYGRDTSTPNFIHSTKDTFVTLTGLDAASTNFFYVRSKCSDVDSSKWATAQYSTNYDCSTFATITCGSYVKQHYRGEIGLYPADLCGQLLNGPEYFHKFTPTQSGYYKFDCISSGGNGIPVGFAYKESSLGCGNSDWNCIGVMFDNSFAMVGPLKAGVEYTIFEKSAQEGGFPSQYIYKIECFNPAPSNDSCSNAITLPVNDYADKCSGKRLSTLGATPDPFINDLSCGTVDETASNDDDIWVKFTATDNVQLFRFTDVKYSSSQHGLVVNFYSEQCNVKSRVDCGYKSTLDNVNNDLISYYFTKGKTYYMRISTFGLDNSASFKLCIMRPGITSNSLNSCVSGITLNPLAKDLGIWVPLLDDSLKIIGSVNFGSGVPRSLTSSLFINHASLRTDANGKYYLDRNITVTPDKNIASSIKVRLYFTNDELNRLINQAGSHVSSINDINVTQTDVACANKFTRLGTFISPTARGDYDANTKYVEFTTDHLSSFFLHGGNTALVSATAFAQSSAATAKSLNENAAIKVSPNPFVNQLNIEVNEVETVKYKIVVTSLDGKPVASFDRTLNAGYNKISLNLGMLTAGVYTLKIEKPNGIEFRKIVKQ
jgi:hypothetical protein